MSLSLKFLVRDVRQAVWKDCVHVVPHHSLRCTTTKTALSWENLEAGLVKIANYLSSSCKTPLTSDASPQLFPALPRKTTECALFAKRNEREEKHGHSA